MWILSNFGPDFYWRFNFSNRTNTDPDGDPDPVPNPYLTKSRGHTNFFSYTLQIQRAIRAYYFLCVLSCANENPVEQRQFWFIKSFRANTEEPESGTRHGKKYPSVAEPAFCRCLLGFGLETEKADTEPEKHINHKANLRKEGSRLPVEGWWIPGRCRRSAPTRIPWTAQPCHCKKTQRYR